MDNYSKLETMLTSFSGGNVSTFYSQEAMNRTIFATNFMKMLSEVEVRSETIDSINDLVKSIINYDISIFDIYSYFGTASISIDDITAFFAYYSEYFSNKKESMLQHIYLTITTENAGGTNSAIMDVVHKINKLYTYDNKCRIIPLIKFGYVTPTDNSYFVNDLAAMNRFYTMSNIQSLVTKLTINNTELQLFADALKASYDNREFYMYRYSDRSDMFDILSFVKNFSYKSGMSEMDVFYNNIFIDDITPLLKEFTKELYKLFMEDAVSFENRGIAFNPDKYLKLITVLPLSDLTKDNYKYEFFKSMIINNDGNLMRSYGACIKILQDYMSDICEAALTDKRFVMGE